MSQQSSAIEKELEQVKLKLLETQKQLALAKEDNDRLSTIVQTSNTTTKNSLADLKSALEQTNTSLETTKAKNRLLEEELAKKDGQYQNLIKSLISEDCLALDPSTPEMTPIKPKNPNFIDSKLDSEAATASTQAIPMDSAGSATASAEPESPLSDGNEGFLNDNASHWTESQLLNSVQDVIVAKIKAINKSNRKYAKDLQKLATLKTESDTLKKEQEILKSNTQLTLEKYKLEYTTDIKKTREKLDKYIAAKKQETDERIADLKKIYEKDVKTQTEKNNEQINKFVDEIQNLKATVSQKTVQLEAINKKLTEKENTYGRQLEVLKNELSEATKQIEALQEQANANKLVKHEIIHSSKSKEEEIKRSIELLHKKIATEKQLKIDAVRQLEINQKNLLEAQNHIDTLNELRLANEKRSAVQIDTYKQALEKQATEQALAINKLTLEYELKLAQQQKDNINNQNADYKRKLDSEYAEKLSNSLNHLKREINTIYENQINELIRQNRDQKISDTLKIQRLELEILALKTGKRVVEIDPTSHNNHYDRKHATEAKVIRNHSNHINQSNSNANRIDINPAAEDHPVAAQPIQIRIGAATLENELSEIIREQAVKEQALQAQVLREKALQEQAQREQLAREQLAREQLAREQLAREQALKIRESNNIQSNKQQVSQPNKITTVSTSAASVANPIPNPLRIKWLEDQGCDG